MRIAVIGAGAVGGTLAALLDRAGHDVAVTARGAHAAAMRAHGLRLTGAWGDHIARVEVSAAVDQTPDLVIVATKATDAIDAVAASAARIDGVPVVVAQNGLESVRSLATVVPRSDLVGALALFAASHLEPGAVAVTAPGSLSIGDESSTHIASHFAARVLDPVIPTTIVDDFRGAQWTKLLINQVNALPAITGSSVQDTIRHRALRRVLVASMRETVAVARAAGIRFTSMSGLTPLAISVFAALPAALSGFLPLAMAKRMGDVPNLGSTLQSISRGHLSEIDYLNGAVVSEARAARVDAPVNTVLLDLVHSVERTGRFLDPSAVVAAVQQVSAKTRRG
ncbi:ketopantoate reductase family protein [Marisediminicola sp. LYQ85]|uniref:ketopantoate reductase family protein n=1 Tax=Marisediminicola sp. LYQ85 TaxID=3391062 RepID=UPI003983232B